MIHDHTLDRTTNGKGPVGKGDGTGAPGALDAGDGETIPRLEEVLELARGKVGVAIEVKSLPVKYPGIEPVDWWTSYGSRHGPTTAVISFGHHGGARDGGAEPGLVGECWSRRAALLLLPERS